VAYSVTATKAPSRMGFRTETAAAALDGVHALRRDGFTEIGVTNLENEAECTEAGLAQTIADAPENQAANAHPDPYPDPAAAPE
jgi:hypothetical protein